MSTLKKVLLIVPCVMLTNFSLVSGQTLEQRCAHIYNTTNICPVEICQLVCPPKVGDEECTPLCLARPCVQIKSEHCPLEHCQLLDGCEGEKVCFDQSFKEPSDCGNLAYAGNLECCDGFVKRCGVQFFDGTCDMKGKYSVYSVPICVECGNGICNQFEDPCNCPEDCKN